MKNFKDYVRKGLGNRLFLNVFAEETKAEETPVVKEEEEKIPEEVIKKEPVKQETNFEDLIKKAREEEKGKLYPELTKLKQDKKDLLDQVSDRDTKIAKLEADLKKAKDSNSSLAKDLETGKGANETVKSLTLTVSQLERKLEEATASHEKELNSVKIDALKEKKIASANGEIIAELVTGETEEEIDASYQLAVDRYNEIANRAVSGSRMPYTNPNAQSVQLKAQASEEEIAGMSMAEFAKYRNSIGLTK